METKYNYVFYNVSDACYEPVLWPLNKYPFIRVYKNAFNSNAFANKAFFLHWSAKLNRKVRLPFKKAWFKKITRQNFQNDKPCCYVFLGGKYLTEEKSLFNYIKSLNSENKVVILCGDLISKKKWDMDKVKSVSDMIVTYDKGEAEKYKVNYYPWGDVYDAIEDVTTPDMFENDVYFLGFAKDRLEEIHKTYKVLAEAGLRCKFIICGTQEKDRVEGEGLHYIPPISYRENLKNVNKSRCILEIIQGGSCAPTLRLREACTYKRKLITNNTNPVYGECLDSSNLLVFEDTERIDTAFAQTPIDYNGFGAGAESPLKFIEFFENNL